MYIATKWNPIYWNTACLIVNSGSLEEDFDEESLEYEDDGEEDKEKEKSTDYSKIAKALGDIIGRGIKISLVDINKSNYSFEPDVQNNQILFGMKALNKIGGPVIEQIISGRPYYGIADFMNRCPLNKSAMISLIKAGAFDNLEREWAQELNVEPRYLVMAYYLAKNCDAKKKLTLQNFNGLIQKDLIPEELQFQKRTFNFNKYLKTYKKVGKYYVFDEACMDFYNTFFDAEELDVINGFTCILQTKWDKIYQKVMDEARNWLKLHHDEVLQSYNGILFLEAWNTYATGNLSSWEMEALCFYYHAHELKHVDSSKYGISNFDKLPETPVVDYFFKRNGKDIPIYQTFKIVGTVISKNKNKSSIDLLTTSGVVTVKFTKEYFAMFGRQISEKQEDGTKKVMEKGWFQRGTKLFVTGYRRDDMFVAKSYKHTGTHQLYRITEVKENGEIELTHDRYGVESNE